MHSTFVVILYLLSLADADTCNVPLLQTYSPVQAFVDRILANSLTAAVGPTSLPLLGEDAYFVGESPNNITTVIELNAPTADLEGSFWLTGVAILQRPGESAAAAYGCAGVESSDLQLFQLQYSKNGVWSELEYDNAPLGLYSFQGVTDAEGAVIRVAVTPTVVDALSISKYYARVARFCFQFELYGCEATTELIFPDVLQYNMPLPNAELGGLGQYSFSDHLYTGTCSNGICTGGAGLLTDGFVESSTYTAYSRFTGWDGSSTYSIQLYLHSVYTINRIILYGSEWLALPVDSGAPDYVTVNSQRFRVKTYPAANEADFSYFGTGVYYISVPVVTTASVLDITFEGSSYYSLLLSEIELVADSGTGSVQLREHVYYANGSSVALEPSEVYSPENITVNQTFPTLPTSSLTTDTSSHSNGLPGNSTLLPALNLTVPLSVTIFVLCITVIVLLTLSIILCCLLILRRNRPKERNILSPVASSPVIDNIHYSPSNPEHLYSAANPQLERDAYETISSFEGSNCQDKSANSGSKPFDSTRYSIVMKDYNHLTPVNLPVHSPLKK